MSGPYILAVDQSTQGTKGLLFDSAGALIARQTVPHKQYVDENGWVEHDPEELLANTLRAANGAIGQAGVDPGAIAAMGISNQRETVMAWDRVTGKPLYRAIVWQCARAEALCAGLQEHAEEIKARSGLKLSPYFSAGKLSWLLQNVPAVAEAAAKGTLCCGTIDSWLIFKLSREQAFKTDFSNAARTQLFNIYAGTWDVGLCRIFGVPPDSLPEVCMSDSLFGTTDLGGWLKRPIPIRGVLGDSNGALLAQQCLAPGSIKATYGTGSSVMLQTGERPVRSETLATSLAWGLGGKRGYVLEGNVNYAGAVITWLREEVGLLRTDADCEALAGSANPQDHACFVPAFTGLGAPYWDGRATGLLTGITRTTGRAEIVKACVDSIAYQITAVVRRMCADAGIPIPALRVDGGPTANRYLMQRQSDLTGAALWVPQLQELSGMGAAFAAGLSAGVYQTDTMYDSIRYTTYQSQMPPAEREEQFDRWLAAVRQALTHT